MFPVESVVLQWTNSVTAVPCTGGYLCASEWLDKTHCESVSLGKYEGSSCCFQLSWRPSHQDLLLSSSKSHAACALSSAQLPSPQTHLSCSRLVLCQRGSRAFKSLAFQESISTGCCAGYYPLLCSQPPLYRQISPKAAKQLICIEWWTSVYPSYQSNRGESPPIEQVFEESNIIRSFQEECCH